MQINLELGTWNSFHPTAAHLSNVKTRPRPPQQAALDSRQFKGTQFYAGELEPFELKNAEPSTDYQVEFNCALGPALGSVSHTATVRTESIINKSKKP